MGRFHRNIMRAYIKMVLHFVYFIFSLYYAHWFIISKSLLWPIGIAIWVMWFWAVIFDDIRMILYDLDWIEIEKTGLSASRFGKKKMLFWSEIVEVTIRDGVGIGDNNISNTHAVFSKHQLPIELQSYLCSDFDPWLNTTEYLEFHAGTIMKKSIAGDLIAENCAFFQKLYLCIPFAPFRLSRKREVFDLIIRIFFGKLVLQDFILLRAYHETFCGFGQS